MSTVRCALLQRWCAWILILCVAKQATGHFRTDREALDALLGLQVMQLGEFFFSLIHLILIFSLRFAGLHFEQKCPKDSEIRITDGLRSLCISQCSQQPFTNTAYAE